MIVDTHAHLDFPDFAQDREAVLERARQAGVTAIVTIGIDVETSRAAVALAEQYPGVYASVGLHPHEAARGTEEAYRLLADLARHPRVVAIGEIGLDYHYDRPPRAVQQEAFRRQIRMAVEAGLPVIVHAREAYDDVLDILREEGACLAGGVMHCFSGDVRVAEQCLSLGFHLSLAGPVTFRNAQTTKEVASRVPLDRLLVETDCPFLSPHPYRGQRNEPARVVLVVEEIARLRGLSYAEVAAATAANARRLFRLNGRSGGDGGRDG